MLSNQESWPLADPKQAERFGDTDDRLQQHTR